VTGGAALEQAVALWSEPPYAVIGVYTGTMASYARPFQFADFYEGDRRVLDLSLPAGGGRAYFRYLADARGRGAAVRVFAGEERKTFEREAPRGFYHALIVETALRDRLSDVAKELMTREAVRRYLDSLAEEGVICFHVSNRDLDLVPVVADVAADLKLACKRGRDWTLPDDRDPDDAGRFTSEWVLVARKAEYLEYLTVPEQARREGDPYWSVPVARGRHVWRDGAANPTEGLRRKPG
jgi:hypothetical protein